MRREIRRMKVTEMVSEVSAIPAVRKAMVAQQKKIAKMKGVIMDGRDIGTVVFPEAECKFFVTASAEIRAKRRYDELKLRGDKVHYDEILKNITELMVKWCS